MTEPCREFIARGKACGDVAAARLKVAEHYAQDGGRHEVVGELLNLLDIATCPEP
jgi:hypothetical protein